MGKELGCAHTQRTGQGGSDARTHRKQKKVAIKVIYKDEPGAAASRVCSSRFTQAG